MDSLSCDVRINGAISASIAELATGASALLRDGCGEGIGNWLGIGGWTFFWETWRIRLLASSDLTQSDLTETVLTGINCSLWEVRVYFIDVDCMPLIFSMELTSSHL